MSSAEDDSDDRHFPIVGIGSSAGGLEALERLLGAMRPDSGLGFVVVAHLDPTRESHLAHLLGRRTEMPVVEVHGATKVEPNRVYVIAPDQDLTLREGVLHPSEPSEPRGQRRSIDVFLRSLAEDQGPRAIGIVLSGTGANGALGLRAIKAAGGVALAQDPGTAGYGGMPQSAIATGIVDLVLPPESMPEALLNLARHPFLRRPVDAVEHEAEAGDRLSALLALLRARTRQEFRCYKKRTLLRRIHRRMGLRHVESLAGYTELLRNDPAEVTALARDLTINVTGFFRDPEAWKALDESVIAPLVEEGRVDAPIRVWAPGCATGEEAYSIAMLLAERMEAAQKALEVKIFASDVAADVLASGRAGLYPASIAADVSPERLRRFFEPEDDSYRVKKAVREMVVFAPQNLLQDPPFSRLDLISCRNLLIYLEPDVQKRVIALFHFGLREGGHLFLGSAETVTGNEELFQPVSKKWRIYRRIGVTRQNALELPIIGAGERYGGAETRPPAPYPEVRRVGDLAQRALLERYAPASVLIDRRMRVHYFHGPTEDYLKQPDGEPTDNLLALAREGLHGRLRAAVHKALAEGREIVTDGRVGRGGSLRPVRLTVRPLGAAAHQADSLLLVSFVEREAPPEASAPAEIAEHPSEQQLEAELNALRDELRGTMEQMETSNEELRASNEEIISINEELQSTNEELETSKEELQSLNEELNTVNSQLQAKLEELEARTNDLNNLLNSTDVATLFLDGNLRIRWFTPAMKTLLELMPADIGRPIYHFAQKFTDSDFVGDAERVLRTLQPADAEVTGDGGRWYIRHVTPYRTEDDRIAGVAVTFTDITERKRWEQGIAEAKEFAEKIVDTVPLPLVVLAPDLRVRSANGAFYRSFKVNPEETAGRMIYELGNDQWDIPELRRLLEEILPEDNAFDGYELEHVFETIGRRTMLLNARRLDAVQMILLAVEDITERKRAEQQRQLLTGELSHRVKNTLATVQSLAVQTLRESDSLDSFAEAFEGRLLALARCHDLLVESRWRGAGVRELVERVVAPYHGAAKEQVTIDCAEAILRPHAGLALAMILHELATNAAKYGALSTPAGRLHVSCARSRSEQDDELRLRWVETDGPRIEEPPAERGFGTRLIERSAGYELRGSATLEFAEKGLRCEIVFPLGEALQPG